MAAWQFQKLQNIADKHGWHQFISMQNYHNLLYREEEREMIPYCNAHGIGIIPWGPLHAGDLARPLGQTTARTEQAKGGPFERPHSEVDKIIIGRVDERAVSCARAYVSDAKHDSFAGWIRARSRKGVCRCSQRPG